MYNEDINLKDTIAQRWITDCFKYGKSNFSREIQSYRVDRYNCAIESVI